MASPSLTETMRSNRAESLARRSTAGQGVDSGSSSRLEGVRNLRAACEIEVDRIIPDADQPRKEFDEDALDRLAASLKARGQLQPIRVRWSAEAEHYVVVVGERRWRAARMAGMTSIACVVVQGEPSAEDLLEDQLIENALREGLAPVEQARAYRALMEARGLTQRDLAERLQIDHTSITRALGLLTLPDDVQALVDNGELPASSAYQIATKIDSPEEQVQVAARVVAEGLSRAETVAAVNRSPRAKSAKPKKSRVVTERTIRTGDGYTVKLERRKGLTEPGMVEALEAALAVVRAEREGGIG